MPRFWKSWCTMSIWRWRMISQDILPRAMQSSALAYEPHAWPRGHLHYTCLPLGARTPISPPRHLLQTARSSASAEGTGLWEDEDLHVLLMSCLVPTAVPQSHNTSALWFPLLCVCICAAIKAQRAHCHRWPKWCVKTEKQNLYNLLKDWEKKSLIHSYRKNNFSILTK